MSGWTLVSEQDAPEASAKGASSGGWSVIDEKSPEELKFESEVGNAAIKTIPKPAFLSYQPTPIDPINVRGQGQGLRPVPAPRTVPPVSTLDAITAALSAAPPQSETPILPGVGTELSAVRHLATPGQRWKGATEVVQGAGEVASPLLGPALAETAAASSALPALKLGGGLVAGIGAQAAAKPIAKAAGASPQQQEFWSELAFWAPTTLGLISSQLKGGIESTPEGTRGAVSTLGGKVGAGVAVTPEGVTIRGKAGPFEGSKTFSRGPQPSGAPAMEPPTIEAQPTGPVSAAANSMAQAEANASQARMRAAGVPPPPPPAPPQIADQPGAPPELKQGHIPQKLVDSFAGIVSVLPENLRAQAIQEAHGTLARVILEGSQKGPMVGPDGKLIAPVKDIEGASKVAIGLINDAIGAHDKVAAAAEKEAAKGAGAVSGEATRSSITKTRAGLKKAGGFEVVGEEPKGVESENGAVNDQPDRPIAAGSSGGAREERPVPEGAGGEVAPTHGDFRVVGEEPRPQKFQKGEQVVLSDGRKGTVRWTGTNPQGKDVARVITDEGKDLKNVDPATLKSLTSEPSQAKTPLAAEGNAPQHILWSRHGETELDVDATNETVAGWTPEPLDERGIASAKKLAGEVKEHKPTVIISSDLERAKQTADIVGKELGIPVKTDERLRPQHVPETEGLKVGAAKPIWQSYEDEPDKKPEGGESWKEFETRQAGAIKDIHDLIAKGERPMVVTHSRNLESAIGERPEPGEFVKREVEKPFRTRPSEYGPPKRDFEGKVPLENLGFNPNPAEDFGNKARAEVERRMGGALPRGASERRTLASKTEEGVKPGTEGGASPAPVKAENPPAGVQATGETPKYKFGNTQAPIHPDSEAAKALESARARISDSDLMGKGRDIGDGGNHVTVRYGIQGEDTAGIKKFLSQQAPFEASLGKTEKFPPSEHSDGAAVIQAPIEAPELHRLNAELEKHGDFTEPSFKQFRPHATIAYVKPDKADRYVGMGVTEGKKFTIDTISITDRNGGAENVKLLGRGVLQLGHAESGTHVGTSSGEVIGRSNAGRGLPSHEPDAIAGQSALNGRAQADNRSSGGISGKGGADSESQGRAPQVPKGSVHELGTHGVDLKEETRPVTRTAQDALREGPSVQPEGQAQGVERLHAVRERENAQVSSRGQNSEPKGQFSSTDLEPGSLADHLSEKIAAGEMPKDNPALKKLVDAFDGKPADPARMKQAQEALEVAIVQRAREIAHFDAAPRLIFDKLVDLYNSQPNLNVRTSTSIENQAYSTPAPLAYLADKLAGVDAKTTLFEPTAGNGMLTIAANPKNVRVNELNPERAEALRKQKFNETTSFDAAEEWGRAQKETLGKQYDAVVANPPFGSVKDAQGTATKVRVDGYKIGQIDHLIAARALAAMKDNGKATLILGANKFTAGGQSADDSIFLNWLYSHYNVSSHFEVEGRLYGRQGAAWPVRVITIDGRQESSAIAPAIGSIQRASTWPEVFEQFNQGMAAQSGPARERGADDSLQRQPADESQPVRNPSGTAPERTDRGRPGASAAGAVERSGEPVGPVSDRNAGAAGGVAVTDPDVRPDADIARSDQLEKGHQPESRPERTAKPGSDHGSLSTISPKSNDFQTPYKPASSKKDANVLIPVNMKSPLEQAMNSLEDRVGDIDKFVAKELGYDSVADLHDAFMGLQVDSVAAAIDQIKNGKAIVIADQTGIGKGRQAAAIIRWAAKNGDIPVFITKTPSLFTDMYGDLSDIGTDDVNPFIVNSDEWITRPDGSRAFANKPGHKRTLEQIRNSGQLPGDRNAVFLTYSQINVPNTQQQMLSSLARKAVFVLDESHNAGGSSNTGDFLRGLLADAKGVTYLSATYAKRPDNMPLYFKTDMGEAIGDSGTLVQAMKDGGLPLQTVVSNNLVKAGQMFRRERSYDGISMKTKVDTDHRAEHTKIADGATSALRAIVDADHAFHTTYVEAAQEQAAKENKANKIVGGGNEAGKSVHHTEFSSVVHNFVRQMLLGIKADTAADDAIASIKRGEKPVIAVDNTMGSFLSAYVGDKGIHDGETLADFDYRTVLSRALDRSRYLQITNAQGDKTKKYVSLGELDPVTRKAYDDAQKTIDKLNIDLPVSPIDWIRQRIADAGYSVGEITGRNLSVDYSDTENPKLSHVPTQEQNDKVETIRRFNDGRLDSLILNVAGSTGISAHASEKFKDQKPRHMIVAQPAQDINIFMQMLGRINRTGQVKLPGYTILNADLPAEKRPTALLSKKMKSLNANTSSNTESATSVKAADMLNEYGDQIIGNYLGDNPQLAKMLHVTPLNEDGSATEDIARKATGRLAILPVKVQEAFYNEVEQQYNDYIAYLDSTNQNELEPKTFDYDARETSGDELVAATNPHSPFGEAATYGEYSIKSQGKPLAPEEVTVSIKENLDGKTPSAHAKELIEKLNGDLVYYKQSLDPDSPNIGQSEVVARTARDFIRDHEIGSTWRVEINGDIYNAAVTNVRSTHKTTGNPFAFSKINVTLATNGSLRTLSVPATQLQRIEVSKLYDRPENIFRGVKAETRETAKIITGNLLAAYGELKDTRGTIINFSKQDGTTEQGILLPKKFDFSQNTKGDYRLRDAAHAVKFLRKSMNPRIEDMGIASRDGNVRVVNNAGKLEIVTPKSKARGGKYFLDHGITDLTGDFVSQQNTMRAPVPKGKEAQVIEQIMRKSALYASPSMAEEAKSLGPKEPVAPAKPVPEETPRVVPGARSATTGNETGTTSIQDLTDSIKHQIPEKAPLKERLRKAADIGEKVGGAKDAVTDALNRLKGSMAALWDAYNRPPQWGDYEDATGKWSGADQTNALDLQRFTTAIKKAVPSKLRREAISNWIEAAGDKGILQKRAEASSDKWKPGYEAAMNLSDEEETIARNIMNRNDATLEEAQNAGILQQGVENYVRHVYADNPKAQAKIQAELNFASLQTKPSFTKERKIPTYFDAEQMGFVPKDKDVGYLTAIHERSFREALAARAYIKSLMKGKAEDGRPLVMTSWASAHVIPGEEGVRAAAYLIKPNIKRGDEAGDYMRIDHPALRGWKWAGSAGTTPVDKTVELDNGEEFTSSVDEKNSIFVQGDALVHPAIYQKLKNNLTKSAIRAYAVDIAGHNIRPGEFALNASAEIKHAILSFSGFHQTTLGLHSLEHRTLPAGMPELDLNQSDQKAAIEHGLIIAAYDAEEQFGEGVASGGLVTKLPGVGPLYHTYTQYLFNSYLPRVKMATYLNALERNRARYKDELTDDQIHAITAEQTNASFGGLNYRMLGRSKTLQDVLRLGLMAPDFFEARARYVGQAGKPYGREQLVALVGGALALYTIARMLNMITDRDPHWDKPFSVVYRGKEYGMRTVQEDLFRFVTGPGQFLMGRLSPIVSAGIHLGEGRNRFGRHETFMEWLKDVGSSEVPIPAQPWTRPSKDSNAMKAVETVAKMVGVNIKNAEDKFSRQAIISELRKGNDKPLREAVREKKVTLQEAMELRHRARLSPLQDKARHEKYGDLLRQFNAASDADKKELLPILREKRLHLLMRGQVEPAPESAVQ